MKFGRIDTVSSSSTIANLGWTGQAMTGTAGENLVLGDIVYLKSDGKYWKAKANSNTTMPAVGIATGSITADASGTILTQGTIRNDSWTWTTGGQASASAGLVWVSDATAGLATQTKPSASSSYVQLVGYAQSATILSIRFDTTYVGIV